MLQHKRYFVYYILVTVVIVSILKMEDYMDGDLAYLSVAGLVLSTVRDFFLILAFVVLLSVLAVFIIHRLNKRYPWDARPVLRFVVELSIIITLVLSLTLIISSAGNFLELVPPDEDNDFGFEILSVIMLSISLFMIFTFHEFVVLRSERELLRFRAEVLEKQNYLAKYEALKNQVNPHFLFNSLNVLSSLIYIDASKSDLFIKKFAEVFRYVLELNQEVLVPVKRELQFIDSYLFLQHIRYAKNLCVKTVVSAHVLHRLIPPLTLQLVIENAIKHNVVSDENQLIITIQDVEDKLIIRNNFQPRLSSEESVGIGQQNLMEKYKLIAEAQPRFYVENGYYIVELPLIASV